MIPQTLHRIVLPPMTTEDRRPARYWRQFRRLHPGWDLRTWTEPLADGPLSRLYASARGAVQVADILRLDVLWRFGGFYVDTDCEPVRALDPLLELGDFIIGSEDGEHLSTGVIGATKEHPAIAAYIDALLEPGLLPSSLPPNLVTGPGVATSVLEGRRDVTVTPRQAFYPEAFASSQGLFRTPAVVYRRRPDVYIVHRWAHSWSDKTPTLPDRTSWTWGQVKAAIKRAANLR